MFTSYKVLSVAWRKFQLPGRDLKPTNQRRKFSAYQVGKTASCHAKVKVLVTQSCLTLSDPMDHSPPGSSVHRILQAEILEWVATLFSRGSFWPRDWTRGLLHCRHILYHLSHQGSPFMPWTVTKQGCWENPDLLQLFLRKGLVSSITSFWKVKEQVTDVSRGFSYREAQESLERLQFTRDPPV